MAWIHFVFRHTFSACLWPEARYASGNPSFRNQFHVTEQSSVGKISNSHLRLFFTLITCYRLMKLCINSTFAFSYYLLFGNFSILQTFAFQYNMHFYVLTAALFLDKDATVIHIHRRCFKQRVVRL